MSFRDLLEKNKRWWSRPGSKHRNHPVPKLQGYYDRNEILEENRNSGKIIELNKYVITLDSQDDTSDDVDHGFYVDKDILKMFHSDKEIRRFNLANVLAYTFQRPYIDFLADSRTAKNIYEYLADVKDIGLICVNITRPGNVYVNNAIDKSPGFKGNKGSNLTITNHYGSGIVSVDTGGKGTQGSTLDGKKRYADMIKSENLLGLEGDYDVYYCNVIYEYWANSNAEYYIPEGYVQSDRSNPTEYLIDSLIRGATRSTPQERSKSPVRPSSPRISPKIKKEIPIQWPEGRTVNGKRYGLWVNYNKGVLEDAGNYMDGVKTGAWTTYNPTGTINSTGIYRNNVRDGPWLLFYQEGMLNAEGPFKNDKQSGKWTVYHKDGKFKKYVNFK